MAAWTKLEGVPRAYQQSQNLTGSAPSASTDGFPVNQVQSLYVIVSANSGQTLSGGGSLLCYSYDAALARWARMPSGDVGSISSSVRDHASAGYLVAVPRGRLCWVPSSVTVSSGTTVTVTAVCHDPTIASTY